MLLEYHYLYTNSVGELSKIQLPLLHMYIIMHTQAKEWCVAVLLYNIILKNRMMYMSVYIHSFIHCIRSTVIISTAKYHLYMPTYLQRQHHVAT